VIQPIQGFLPELRAVIRKNYPPLYAKRAVGFILVYTAFLVACSVRTPVVDAPALDVTQAYETVEARLTQATAYTPTSTQTTEPTQLPTVTPNPGSSPDPVRTAAPSPTEICDKAAPGFPMIDVNIEDGTEMQAGQRFTKIWRLTNAGACTWTREYQAIWFYGTRLGDSTAIPLTRNVAPGESIEIEVEMVAPQIPGTYRSDWKLQNSSGVPFGIGPSGNSTFWVEILVVQTPTETPAPTSIPTDAPEPTNPPQITETVIPPDEVRLSATLILDPNSTIDLDDGLENPESGADMSYQPDENGNHWLTPLDNFLLGVYGTGEPNREICQLATMSSAPIAVGSLSPGTVLCYQTDTGLPGWMRLVGFDEEDASIEIDILTWKLLE
jgi:hypothetical protein